MEKYPNNNEPTNEQSSEILHTEYEEVFYRLLGHLDQLHMRINDESLPEEEREEARATLDEWGEKIGKELDFLDGKDKEKRARIENRQPETRRQSIEELASDKEGQIYVDSQGLVHDTPGDALLSEPDYWQKNAS